MNLPNVSANDPAIVPQRAAPGAVLVAILASLLGTLLLLDALLLPVSSIPLGRASRSLALDDSLRSSMLELVLFPASWLRSIQAAGGTMLTVAAIASLRRG